MKHVFATIDDAIGQRRIDLRRELAELSTENVRVTVLACTEDAMIPIQTLKNDWSESKDVRLVCIEGTHWEIFRDPGHITMFLSRN
jgi:hypothetical protein